MSSGQRQALEGTLAALRRLTLDSGITPTFCTRWRRQLARQDSQSPSNLSRERLLVGGKRAFGVGDVDAGAKKGAPSRRALFLVPVGISALHPKSHHEDTKVTKVTKETRRRTKMYVRPMDMSADCRDRGCMSAIPPRKNNNLFCTCLSSCPLRVLRVFVVRFRVRDLSFTSARTRPVPLRWRLNW